MPTSLKAVLSKYLWLICLILGSVGALISWFAFPHDREQATLLQYLVHIVVFVIILAGISFFPNQNRWAFLLLLIPIFVFNMFLAPKLTYFAERDQYESFYNLFFVVLYPMMLCSICLAYRLGGGKPEISLKIGVIGVLVLFSGIMDFMWFILNGLDYRIHATSIPHIQVVIGHVPNLTEIIVFISIHMLLSIGLLFIRFDKTAETRPAHG